MAAGAVLLLLECGLARSWAARPEVEAYWWLDEVREAAAALARARGEPAPVWPRMSVSPGSASLPLPEAAGAVTCDGRLDEPAWSVATAFPVGPLFGPWREGPFVLRVRAVRVAGGLALGIESDRDLRGLASAYGDRALLRARRAIRVDTDGRVPGGSWRAEGRGGVLELVLSPAEGKKGTFAISFPTEVDREGPRAARRSLPGLSRSRSAVWLREYEIRLLAARRGVRIALDRSPRAEPASAGRGGARGERIAIGSCDAARVLGSAPLAAWRGRVRPWSVKARAEGHEIAASGFLYRSPLEEEALACRKLRERSEARGNGKALPGELRAQIASLEREFEASGAPAPGTTRRDRYRRARELRARARLATLDAPLLFTRRHPYYAGHIYDDYYTWHPGGDLSVRENPSDLDGPARVRAVIGPGAPESLGEGVYRDPELSWDATRIVFAYRSSSSSDTNVYEIGIDGHGLRRLTPEDGYHDITPCYLPDDRVVFTSTRPRALVPCFNSGVDTLHVTDRDGRDTRSISSNNVNEFDPAVLPDGRILYGRWEYVDKTALYMQSLWTMCPDGERETALFGNNLARPTAILDARPVPGTSLVVATLTPHNGQAVGAIAVIDPARGKNDLGAITNLTPEYPTEMDQGLREGPCDPWPLSAREVLISNNHLGGHGVIELIGRDGRRDLVHADPEISCFAPMLVRPRERPPVVAGVEREDVAREAPAPPREAVGAGAGATPAETTPVDATAAETTAAQTTGPETTPAQTTTGRIAPRASGRFLLLDVYRGLAGVERGSVKALRIVEETARTSGLPPGGRWWNQAFLVSWQGSYVIKNVLGTVPVHEDGSAYFEVPTGVALYVSALDAHGREVQRMRTFVQAVPGVTRSCMGCHERRESTPSSRAARPRALDFPPARPRPESWGSGMVDFPTMVQPVLDRRCVCCHGGEEGIAAGLDLSGGWTWAFNIAYESLLARDLVGFLRCHNSDVSSSRVLPPRTIGSGAAPLGDLLVEGHEGMISDLRSQERDLLLAWMDGNSNYYGTWDYTENATCNALLAGAPELSALLRGAGCQRCHAGGAIGRDWVNLRTPERSRLLRAPLAPGGEGLGLGWCRDRKAPSRLPLVTQRLLPPDRFHPRAAPRRDPGGEPVVTFRGPDDPSYRRLLAAIRRIRAAALARPRIDMPGARIVPGECRRQTLQPVPERAPAPAVALESGGSVILTWRAGSSGVGLEYEVHRSRSERFFPGEATLVSVTTAFRYRDPSPPEGRLSYALVARQGERRSAPSRVSLVVPALPPPAPPTGLRARPGPGEIELAWAPSGEPGTRYAIERRGGADRSGSFTRVEEPPLDAASWIDPARPPGAPFEYRVVAIDRRGRESAPSALARATAAEEIREPVFTLDCTGPLRARLRDGTLVSGSLRGEARLEAGAIDLRSGGHATFAHRGEFDLARGFSIECRVRLDEAGEMPVVVSCGEWKGDGWFLQRFGGAFRWHVGGVDCDGGRPLTGRALHLLGVYDGRRARLYQDGVRVADVACRPRAGRWPGPLHIGQYAPAPAPRYQVKGSILGLRIWRRGIRDAEARELAAPSAAAR